MESFVQKSIRNMLRTEVSTTYKNIEPRILHAMMGLADEGGELTEMILRCLFYNQKLDITHLKDELGDHWWYLCLAVDYLAKRENKTADEMFQEILAINSAKLHIRYPESYSDKQALTRDLQSEKIATEDASHKRKGDI